MPPIATPTESVKVFVPIGMLGGGFAESIVERGLELGPDVIAVDSGSTDSGPYYLGSATAKSPAASVARDLRLLLRAAARAGIPLIVGSCGTSGTDAGVDWVAGITARIMAEEGLELPVARIYSEQRAADLREHLAAGRIHPLPPLGELDPVTLDSCTHIVGLMGHEPIVAALEAGAQVVLAGRATDTAVAAAVPLLRGMPAGPTWHASKIVECGAQATTNPRTGGIFATIDREGFTIEAVDPGTACTPTSVAAHMLYENADPFLLTEPDGVLDVRHATYRALDDRRVRVEGSVFRHAAQHTVKLEGARVTGYQTVSFVGVREPLVLADPGRWADLLRTYLYRRAEEALGMSADQFEFDLRLYGYDAVLGALDPGTGTPRELGVMLVVSAADQETATAVAKVMNPYLLHMPTPEMDYLPSFAFATSPAETERGAAYEFVLHHVVDSPTPTALFRTETGVSAHA
ncbi:acyclic terpene utilization AtuA family protein [Promicromonospora sp. NPDC050880]|uniref:acyclic terpene utilization AtuA family protein n=1 Tax=unclassified Promicromonospora TaxID=2647929 RepID=UPI0037AC2223